MAKKKKRDFSNLGSKFNKKFKKKVEAEKYSADDRFYKVTWSDNQTTNVTMRFLPFVSDDDVENEIVGAFPLFTHWVKSDAGKVMIETCPRTRDIDDKESCPLCELAGEYYNNRRNHERGTQKFKYWDDLARNVKATPYFIANVYIVNDPEAPENNGKVFLYKMPKTVYNMVKKACDETIDKDDDEVSGNVFDPINGYNFKLKLFKKGGMPSYDKCRFINKPIPIVVDENDNMDEDAINEVLDNMIDLVEVREEYIKKIKSYELLAKKLDETLNSGKSKQTVDDDYEDDDEDVEEFEEKPKKKKKKVVVEDDDEDEEFFDDEEDEEDEEETPKKSKKAKKSKKVVEEDEDDDVDFLDDDDDDFLDDDDDDFL